MRFMYLFLLLLPIVASANIANENNSTTNFKKLSDFYNNLIRKNNSYLGAFLSEENSETRKRANISLYMPTVTYSLTQNKSNVAPSEITTYEQSQSLTQALSMSGKLPHAGLSYSSSIYNNAESKYFYNDQRTSVNNVGSFDFSISLDLLKGFGPVVGGIPFTEADLNLKKATQTKIQSVFSIISELFSSYNQAYVAQKNLNINLENSKKIQEDLRKSQEQFKEGKIPKLSLLGLEAQNQQFFGSIITQEKSLRESLKSLFVSSSIEEIDVGQVDINQKLEPIKMPFFNEARIDQWVKSPLEFETLKNPEYLIEKYNLELSKLTMKKANNDILPTLQTTFKTFGGRPNGLHGSPLFPHQSHGQEYAVSISMPLGLFQERANRAIASNDLRLQELTLRQLERRLTRDWNNLINQYELQKRQLSISKALAQAARDRYEASVPTAQLGSTYQANVISFQNELVSALLNLNQAEMDILTTQLKIFTFRGDSSFIESFSKN